LFEHGWTKIRLETMRQHGLPRKSVKIHLIAIFAVHADGMRVMSKTRSLQQQLMMSAC